MLVDVQVHACNSFVLLDRGWRENRPPHLKGNITNPIKFINCAIFSENKTGKCFFPLSTIKNFHTEIVFVVWLRDLSWEVKIVCLFLQESTSRKFLILLLFYLPVFYCKYRQQLLLFSLIVIAFPACTCESVDRYTAPFLVFLRGVRLRCVGLTRKISAHCNTGSYVFSFFFIFIFILFLAYVCYFNSLSAFPQIWK